MRNEEEVNKMIEDMIKRNKGKYITQGVSFNKTCPRQLDLLKKSLMASASFSGLAKEMLALRFDEKTSHQLVLGSMGGRASYPPEDDKPKTKNIGNFI